MYVKDVTPTKGYHKRYMDKIGNHQTPDFSSFPFEHFEKNQVRNESIITHEGRSYKMIFEDKTFDEEGINNLRDNIRSQNEDIIENLMEQQEEEKEVQNVSFQSKNSYLSQNYPQINDISSPLPDVSKSWKDINFDIPPFPLSLFIKTQLTHSTSNSKISAVGQMITCIGDMSGSSRYCSKVKKLFLSNNGITNLEGIGQFRNLESLSLANNLIKFMSDVSFQELQSLNKLEFLIMEGNRVCYTPMYREKIIHLLPSLQKLDQNFITREERSQSLSSLRREEILNQTALKNTKDIIWREHMKGLISCHSEMLHSVYGGFRY